MLVSEREVDEVTSTFLFFFSNKITHLLGLASVT